jgi:hypothetical protein
MARRKNNGYMCYRRERVPGPARRAEYRSVLTATTWSGYRYLSHIFYGLERVR